MALIPFGQCITMPLRVPPKWLATCLVHWNGVLPAHAQPMAKCGNVVGSPHVVDVIHHLLGFADDAVERHHLVVGAFRSALGARAVVADDVEEQRVVQLADLLELRDEPADLGVGVLGEAGEGLHLPLEEPLLLRRSCRPTRESPSDAA